MVQVSLNNENIVIVDGSWRPIVRNLKFLRNILPRSLEDIERKSASPSNHSIPLITDVNSEPRKEEFSNEVATPTQTVLLSKILSAVHQKSITPPASLLQPRESRGTPSCATLPENKLNPTLWIR